MVALSNTSIREWSDQLRAISELLSDEVPEELTVTPASIGGPVAVPAAVEERFNTYELKSSALAEVLGGQDIADPTVQQAFAAIAAGDLEAAIVAAALDERTERVSTASAGDDFLISAADEIETQLRGLTASGGQTEPPRWRSDLQSNLGRVIDDAGVRLVTLGTSNAVSQVAGDLYGAVANVGGGHIRDILDQVKDAISWLKRKALALLAKALDKIAKLFGQETEDAVRKWTTNTANALAGGIFGALAGRDTALQHWDTQATNGANVASRIGAVVKCTNDHLDQLKWAGRGITLLGITAPILVAAAGVGGISLLARSVIAVALAGWIFWAAWDDCRDITALV